MPAGLRDLVHSGKFSRKDAVGIIMKVMVHSISKSMAIRCR
jgi:hypothetical protein